MSVFRKVSRIVGMVLFSCFLLFCCSVVGPLWLFGKAMELAFPHTISVYIVDFADVREGEKPAFFTGGIKKAIYDQRVGFKDDKLVLHGQPEDGKFGVKEWNVIDRGFTYGILRVKAEADQWAPDTSIGFEMWGATSHDKPTPYAGIVFKDGCLTIVNSSRIGAYVGFVHGWETLKKKPIVLDLNWSKESVQLSINGKIQLNYTGVLIPQTNLNCRLNADRDRGDKLMIHNLYLEQ